MRAKSENRGFVSAAEGLCLVIIILFVNIIMTFAVFLLAAYAIVPIIGDVVSIFSKTAQYQLVNYLNEGQDVVYGICSAAAMFPSCMLVYRLYRPRRKIFLQDTSGKIPTADGVRYHLKKYFVIEVTEIVGVAAISLVNAIVTDSFNTTPFYVVYKYCGILLGLPIAAAVMCAVQLAAILSSQNHWRADYFCDEE